MQSLMVSYRFCPSMKRELTHATSSPALSVSALTSPLHGALSVFKLTENYTSPPAIALLQAKESGGRFFSCTGACMRGSEEPCFVYTIFLRSFSKSTIADITRHIEALARLDGYNFLKIYGVHKDDNANALFVTTECPPTITLQTLFQDSIITRQPIPERNLLQFYVQYLHIVECLSETKSLPAAFMQCLIDPKYTMLKTRELIKINTIEAYLSYLSENNEALTSSTVSPELPSLGRDFLLNKGPSVGIGLRATSTSYQSQMSSRSCSTSSTLSMHSLGCMSASMNSLSNSYCSLDLLSSSKRSNSRGVSTKSTRPFYTKKATEESLLQLINQLILMVLVVPQLPAQITCESNPELALSILKVSISSNFYKILGPAKLLENLVGRKISNSLLSCSGTHRCERVGYAGSLILNNLGVFNTKSVESNTDSLNSSSRSGSNENVAERQQLTLNEITCDLFLDRPPWIATILMMEPLRSIENFIRATFYPDRMGVTSLMRAAISNDVLLAQDYIYQSGIRDLTGNTALMYAARIDAVDVAKLLAKTESGLRNKRKDTALMIAVESGSLGVVRLLAGLELGLRDFGTRNPFMLAFQAQNIEILKTLLEEGQSQGNLHQLTGCDANATTYLMRAIDTGNTELVHLLIPYMAGRVNSNGMTALMLACEKGRTEEALELVESEAGIIGPEGYTALMYATLNNNKTLVKALIQKEAGLITTTGEFALHLAFTSRADGCINLLTACEGPLLKHCKFTPLMKAVSCYSINSFKVMQTSFSGRKDSFGYTALMFACIFNRKEAVEALLPTEGDIVLANGTTPFILALRHGSIDSVNAIINYYEMKLSAQSELANHAFLKGVLASFISNNSLSDTSSSPHKSGTPQISIQDSSALGSSQSVVGSPLTLSKSTPNLSVARYDGTRDMAQLSTSLKQYSNELEVGSGPLLLSPNVVKIWNTANSIPSPDALLQAVLNNDIDTVFSLRKTHTRKTDDKGLTALMLALRKRYYDIAMLLVRYEHGIQDLLKKTALMYCTDRQSLRLIDALGPFEKGLADFKGKTALYHSYEAKNLVVMERLCKYEAGSTIPILEASKKGKTLLMQAAQDGDCARLKLLLPYEAGRLDQDGLCASRYAIAAGHISCFKLLLEAEMELLKNDNFTNLMLAVATLSSEPLQKYKDDLRRRTKDGHTALMIAVYCNNIPAIKYLLLSEKGIRRPDGRTALMIAAEKDNVEACKLLAAQESGIRIPSSVILDNKQEVGKPVALMLAICAKSVQCIKCLSEYEAKTTETKQRMTSLMIAAQIGHVEAVQVLRCLEAGEQDSLGWTALMHATAWDHPNIVKYLVSYEFELVDENEQSVLDLAVKFGQLSCVKVLAPACALQFGEATLQKINFLPSVSAAARSEIQAEIRRYLDFGKI